MVSRASVSTGTFGRTSVRPWSGCNHLWSDLPASCLPPRRLAQHRPPQDRPRRTENHSGVAVLYLVDYDATMGIPQHSPTPLTSSRAARGPVGVRAPMGQRGRVRETTWVSRRAESEGGTSDPRTYRARWSTC